VDNWKAAKLKKGDIIYGGLPGPSQFYFTKASLDKAGGSKENMWKSVQVKPHAEAGYRDEVQAYEVLEDVDVATSVVKANPHLGPGGATQFFVENFKSVLKPIG
jgi:hypothetical protein